ncbi:MAG: M28 family metallopeptidase [Solirubrobacterales bacterium]
MSGESRLPLPGARRANLGLASVLAVTALLVGAGPAGAAGPGEGGCRPAEDRSGDFDSGLACEYLLGQVRFGPRPAGSAANRVQARWIARRLRGAGARAVRTQTGRRNVVAHVPGTRPGTIVLGAHHDTLREDGFVGANDGASGVAVVLAIARALPRRVEGPAIRIVLFDAEEARHPRPFSVDGMRGSRRYVALAARSRRRGGSPPLRSIRAMVLLDMVGDCSLHIPRESNSDRGLYGAFEGAPFTGARGAVLDDHIPFLRAGIPAVDLIDFTYGSQSSPGRFWHTTADTPDKVCQSSLDMVGEAVLRGLRRIARDLG